jgi:hypothetical protein
MAIKAKHIVIGGGILVATGLLMGIKRTATHLETFHRLAGVKFEHNRLVILLDVMVKNPTATGLRIKYPFVKIMDGGSVLSASESKNEDVHIPSWGEV